jgi:hypothetical protein
MSDTPHWWVHLFMTIPKRRQDAAQLRRVTAGWADPDDTAFQLGSRKAHK